MERDNCFFKCPFHKGPLTIGPTPLLLGVLDRVQEEFNLRVYWKLADIVAKYPNFKMSEVGDCLISTITHIRSYLGRSFHQLIKNWEGLINGFIVKDPENDLGFSGLYEGALSEMEKVHPGFKNSWMRLSLLPRSTNLEELTLYCEMTGIQKLFGHPCLNSTDGFNRVREIATEKYVPDYAIILKIRNQFVKDFSKSYFNKEHKWPRIDTEACSNDIMKNAYLQNRWFSEEELLKLPNQEWTSVNFTKTFDYDYTPDTSELIKDTAVAPPRSSWFQSYDVCGFKNKWSKRRPYYVQSETRCILRYLKGDKTEIDKINRYEFNKENHIILLARKEEEHDEMGRQFATQPYLQRLVQTSGEYNLHKFILPFISQITMSDSELNKGNKEAHIISLLEKPNVEGIGCDFSKWNIRWRHEVYHPIAHQLDNLFGLEHLYQDGHNYYSRCAMLASSRVNPPDYDANMNPVEGEHCYYNHEGGLEGNRQKQWTLINICPIMLVAEEMGLNISILEQGDNVYICIARKQEQINFKDTIRKECLSNLESIFARINHKLKLAETYYTSRFYEYGKQKYINGISVPSATKKIARMLTERNEGSCTIENGLTSLATISESTAKVDWTPDPSFILYVINALRYMKRRGIIDMQTDVKECVSLMFWFNNLGGLPLSSYPNHCLRGIDDRLTMSISLIKHLREYYPDLYIQLGFKLDLVPRQPPDFSYLVQDIFSLNISGNQGSEAFIKDHVLTAVDEYTTNPEVRMIIDSNHVPSHELISSIVSMRPYIANVAHELYACSNEGLMEALRGKFNNITSLVKLAKAQNLESKTFTEMALDKDRNMVLNIRKRWNKSLLDHILENLLNMSNCSTQLAFKLREDSWGFPIIGVTHPVPWEQAKIYPYDDISPEDISKAIQVETSFALRMLGDQHKFMKGPYLPYLGSVTKQKERKPQFSLLEETSISKALNMLGRLLSWGERMRSESLVTLVNILIEEKK